MNELRYMPSIQSRKDGKVSVVVLLYIGLCYFLFKRMTKTSSFTRYLRSFYVYDLVTA